VLDAEPGAQLIVLARLEDGEDDEDDTVCVVLRRERPVCASSRRGRWTSPGRSRT
jgi:hypothetical protein